MARTLPDLDPILVRRVIDIYQCATPAEIDAGMVWYPYYASVIRRHARRHGLTREQATAIFAILSQQSEIDRNLTNFMAVCEDRSTDRCVCISRDMRAKVLLALADRENPGQYARGPKIGNFYLNLLGDYTVVTADRHAISMTRGRKVRKGDQASAADQRDCCRAIEAAAVILGLEAAMLQAIPWLTWQRLQGRTSKSMARIA